MNEVFLDAVDAKKASDVPHLTDAERAALGIAWEHGAEALSPLDKAQTILALLHRAPMTKGAHPYQDAALLMRLRNALAHAKTEWVVTSTSHPGDTASVQRFEAQLGGRVKDNPLTGPGNAYFPDRVLSGDCARWALSSAVDLMDAVHNAMGAASPFDHVRSRFPA
jgi:hypothetical protein